MRVDVLFFASLRDATGCASMALDVATERLDLAGLMDHLQGRLADAGFTALHAESIRVALNQELQNGSFEIRDGDEVAFLPPVTGG